MAARVPHVQVKFFTKLKEYAIPESSHSIPGSLVAESLSKFVNDALKHQGTIDENADIMFDFLIHNEFLRTSVQSCMEENAISTEDVVPVEYVLHQQPPEPEHSIPHDDWVSCIQANSKYLITGLYYCLLKLWLINDVSRDELVTVPAHSQEVKRVAWINSSGRTTKVQMRSATRGTARLPMGGRRCRPGCRAVPIRSCFTTLLLQLLLLLQMSIILSPAESYAVRLPREIIGPRATESLWNSSLSERRSLFTAAASPQAGALHAVRKSIFLRVYADHSDTLILPTDTFSEPLERLLLSVTLENGSSLPESYWLMFSPSERKIFFEAGRSDIGRHAFLLQGRSSETVAVVCLTFIVEESFNQSSRVSSAEWGTMICSPPPAAVSQPPRSSSLEAVAVSGKELRNGLSDGLFTDPQDGVRRETEQQQFSRDSKSHSPTVSHRLPSTTLPPESDRTGLLVGLLISVLLVVLLIVAAVLISPRRRRSTHAHVSGGASGTLTGNTVTITFHKEREDGGDSAASAPGTPLMQNEDNAALPPPPDYPHLYGGGRSYSEQQQPLMSQQHRADGGSPGAGSDTMPPYQPPTPPISEPDESSTFLRSGAASSSVAPLVAWSEPLTGF